MDYNSIVAQIKPGSIIEFLQSNEPQIAWVLETSNDKTRLLLYNRRETTIPIARILPWVGPHYNSTHTKDSALLHLKNHHANRQELQALYNPIELWELAHEDVRSASAQWFCELTLSFPSVDNVAACAHALLQNKTHFKFQPPTFLVHTKETVDLKITEKNAQEKSLEISKKGSIFFKHLWTLHNTNRPIEPSDLSSIESIAHDLQKELLDRVTNTDLPETQLWKTLTKGLPPDPNLPLLLAQAWGILPKHYNFWLDRFEYEPGDEWSSNYSTTIEHLIQKISDQPKNSDIPFISIDSSSTKDIDDAFFIQKTTDKGFELTVALACPAFNWPFDEPLDLITRKRATSIYVPEATYHMLPESLGTKAYSLHANTPCPAILLTCTISHEGFIQKLIPSFSFITLAANLTYEDCELVLNGTASQASPYSEQLHLALSLAQLYQSKRLANGALIIDRGESSINIQWNDNADPTVLLQQSPPLPKAHMLVSELMILINSALATWAYDHAIPLIHRTQDTVIPPQFRGIWKEPYDIAKAMKVLVPSTLEAEPKLHAGLSETHYAPTTSPLRRYPDLVNEAQILHWIQKNEILWNKNEIQNLITQLLPRLDKANQIQRFRLRYWKLMYILQHPQSTWWLAVITELGEPFSTVFLIHEQLPLRIRTNILQSTMQLGDTIQVRRGTVRPLYNEIQLIETQPL